VSYLISDLKPSSDKQVSSRQSFEDNLSSVEKWTSYIDFEVKQGELKRAACLYERAMASSVDMMNHLGFWLKYIHFIHLTLKDSSLARAKFE